MLGLKQNPYPYIKNSDIFFFPSKSEGNPLVLIEAKALDVPILVTNYPTVNDHVCNGFDSLIVPLTEQGIFDGIVEMIVNTKFREEIKNNSKRNKKNALAYQTKLDNLLSFDLEE